MPTPSAAQSPVTVLGLGLMGQALAAAFLANGHPTTVWNRSAAKADDLVAGGAVLAAKIDSAYLDGAILALPHAIGTADAVLLYSGPQAVCGHSAKPEPSTSTRTTACPPCTTCPS